MRRGHTDFILLAALGACALLIAFFSPFFLPAHVFKNLDDLPVWYTYAFYREQLQTHKIVGIVIDQHSISKIGARWPWKRSVYVELLRRLGEEKVNTVGVDFVFVGNSEDPQDDRMLAETIKNSPLNVVLSFFFDPKRREAVMPLPEIKDAADAMGMLNTPIDPDGKIRRARSYVAIDGTVYYSLPVMMAAAYLNKNPDDVVSPLPLQKDRTFAINYMLSEHDFRRISFYEFLNNLDQLKAQWGRNFLNGALVLVYSDTEIMPDTYSTPLGMMPGGLLHLNAAANIITGRTVRYSPAAMLLFAAATFLALFLIVRYTGFILGNVLLLGVLMANFWGVVFLNMRGITFDFSFNVFFSSAFFILASISRSLFFLGQIYRIKEKATIDPLRNLLTPRYFYYRLGLEIKKFYLRKDVFLVFMAMPPFKDATESLSVDELKLIWQGLSQSLIQRGKLWAVYSPEEIVGCVVIPPRQAHRVMQSLKTSLESLLASKNMVIKVKVGCMRYRRSYPMRELLYEFSRELRKAAEDIVSFNEETIAGMIGFAGEKTAAGEEILGTFNDDIEDKNRELLVLIDNLKKEHARTREAFFQIITSLVKALEARDPYTEGHSERVSSYAMLLADKLGWSPDQKDKLKIAALLHDLGKIGIPDTILHKKGKLDDEEYDFIKKHEIIAIRILEPLKEMREILPWILYHHERWDGKGYPHGLGGEAIPQASQIISLADTFDTMTTGRDYKVAYPAAQALAEIAKNKGTQFDPRLVDSFVEVISQSPIHIS